MNYRETLTFLSSLHKMGIRLGLGPVRSLLERLGHPQNAAPAILIAGTNGKGSVAAMTASILTAGGFRTGLYTSPDLIDVRERIRIDGAMIPRAEAAACAERVKDAITEEMSYFEFLTALAFCHFQRQRVDIAVLETGMGGRLDATNVVTPLVSVITNISLEHREYLGRRLEEIAGEKAGIIKENGICLTSAVQAPVLEVLETTCRERRAQLYRVGREFSVRIHRDGTFAYHGPGLSLKRLTCPLPGRHQYVNACLALGVVELVGGAGFRVGDETIAAGLAKTRWEGRLELLGGPPALLVDGAHNPAGVATLCRALRNDFPHRRLILIFGVLGDKDYAAMARRLFPLADKVILTRPQSDRALPPAALLPVAQRFHRDVALAERPADALTAALALAGPEDLICAAGSLYLVGEIKKLHQSGLRQGALAGRAMRGTG